LDYIQIKKKVFAMLNVAMELSIKSLKNVMMEILLLKMGNWRGV